jgi:hypothetical protein
MRQLTKGLTEQVCRRGAGFLNLVTILNSVAAIYATARQIDKHIRAIQRSCPIAKARPIPHDDLPRGGVFVSRQNRDMVALSMKMPR